MFKSLRKKLKTMTFSQSENEHRRINNFWKFVTLNVINGQLKLIKKKKDQRSAKHMTYTTKGRVYVLNCTISNGTRHKTSWSGRFQGKC